MSTAAATSGNTPPRRPRRRLWWWLGGVLLALPVLLLVLLMWLLNSGSGRDVALAQLDRFLPPGMLSWSGAEGRLAGGLVLHDVRLHTDAADIAAQRLELDLDSGALLSGALHLRRIAVSGGKVELPAAAPSDEPPPARIELPDSLPQLVLPLPVRVDALILEDVQIQRDGERLLHVQELTGAASLQAGRLQLQQWSLSSDRIGLALDADIDTASNWASRLRAQARVALEDAEPLPLELRIDGDLNALALELDADLGQAATLRLQTRGGLPEPDWTLNLDAPHLALARLGLEGEPLTLQLSAEGDLRQASLSGRLEQAGFALELVAPSRISYDEARLRLEPLSLGLYDGSARLEGELDLSTSDPQLHADLAWQDIVLPGAAPDAVVRSQGTARIDGPLDDYALTLDGRFARGPDQARVQLAGRGSTQALDLESLHAELPGGGLDAHGRVVWSPALHATLDATLQQFDPSYFAPDLPGVLDARLHLDGGLADAGPFGELRLDGLDGQLRGRSVSGSAQARMQADGHGSGELDLRLGQSHVHGQGHWQDEFDIELALAPLELADLLPEAGGRLDGSLTLRGARDAPSLSAQLDGQSLALAGQTAQQLRLRAGVQAWERGSISIEAQALELGGQDFATLALSGEGSRAAHDLSLALVGDIATLGLNLNGGLQPRDGSWQGELRDLHLEPKERTAWRLREPARLAYLPDTGSVSLSRTCLDAAPAWLCAEITTQGATSQGTVELDGFDLAELDPLLASLLEQPAALNGSLAANGQFQRDAQGRLQAGFQARVPQATLKLDPAAERELLDLADLDLNLTLDPDRAKLQLDARVSQHGHLRAGMEVSTPLEADGTLSGQVDLLLPDIALLELFTDQVVNPQGRVEGRLLLAGTRSQPQLDGTLELLDFSAELPALGIQPREGHIRLSSREATALELDGSLMLGDGKAMIEGRFDLAGDNGVAGTLAIRGEELSVMDVPQARVRASPDLQLELAGQALKLRGSVDVPYARINLEHLQGVASPSSDVVIVDDEQSSGGLAVDADISVTLGRSVRMRGYGLNGTLAGQLRVRDRPGYATTGSGAIEVGGAYKAYGQDLSITRGRVSFASTPIDNPMLDIRAERKIDAVTVGVQVRGTALVPELTLWSDPAMEQAEQLSYLVLGRPLRSASQADGTQLTQAAAAMGGNLLAQNLGARLGIEDVGVSDNRALGGAALTVGMHLSPRLYVSYGVALFGSGQVVTFKYLLSRLWNIQIDSGSENRAALNYRLER